MVAVGSLFRLLSNLCGVSKAWWLSRWGWDPSRFIVHGIDLPMRSWVFEICVLRVVFFHKLKFISGKSKKFDFKGWSISITFRFSVGLQTPDDLNRSRLGFIEKMGVHGWFNLWFLVLSEISLHYINDTTT